MSKSVQSRLLLAVLFVAIGRVTAAGERDVVVRIYDSARLDTAMRAVAIETAAAIFTTAGIRANWHDCTGDAERRHCDHLRDVRSLIVRIRPTLAPGTVPSGSSVETRSRPGAAGTILGFAVVEAAARAGTLATIFMDRIRSVARRVEVPGATLLGRAIAHEVGHLLLATSEHSPSGLMREVWTDAELALDRPDDWLFAPADRVTLQDNALLRPTPDTADGEPAFRRTDATDVKPALRRD